MNSETLVITYFFEWLWPLLRQLLGKKRRISGLRQIS